jgi:Phage tail-collar fibre protein
MAYEVTTRAARVKFAKAHGDGTVLPKITQVGWGTGGVDSGGNPTQPADTLTAVPGQVLKKNIDSFSYPINTTTRFQVSLTKTEANGSAISSCGLYDSAGTLIAVKHFPAKVKDGETEIFVTWDEQF